MFTIYNDSGSDSTMVSNLFIDEYMKSANDAQIKVYLYLLRMMGTHRAASVSDMADQFNHTEKDVVRSLRYWEQRGLLNLDYDSRDTIVSIHLRRPETIPHIPSGGSSGISDGNRVLAFSKPADNMLTETGREHSVLRMASGCTYPAQAALQGDMLSDSSCAGTAGIPETGAEVGIRTSVSAAPVNTVSDSSPAGRSSAPAELQALESFRSREDRAQLLFVIEQYIGKPLSLNEIRIIYNISEGLHFSDDMIDYLLQYCVDRGKKDFRYIKKVADNWAAEGIMTPSQAEQAAAQDAFSIRAKSAKSSRDPAGRADSGSQRAVGKKSGRTSGRTCTANSFNQFEQNSYDFDALEEELLQS